ncbi:MAG TPA: nodulation protein NfeD [Candidatus Limnocylindrales bacterium]|nr:nodulation protein NfeD [Candidatus Limnocylindrales bacterium]
MSRAIRRSLLVLSILAGALVLAGGETGIAVAQDGGSDGGPGTIYVLPTTGTVDNVMAGYIESGLQRAATDGASVAIIQLDTPGGSLASTQAIVSSLLDPPLPVIVWVGPPGAKAASAGTFITLSANLAYMAPGTNIGAASPVGSGGEEIEGTLGDKVMNDAIASITAIAEARGRNVDAAVATVKEAESYPANEAVELGMVDAIAADLEAVRAAADGEAVEMGGESVTLDIADDPFFELPMNPFQSLLHLLSDPNIAFILFTIGFYGLLFELQNPNFVTGILGALAIILAFIGFGSLPLNVAGLILLGLGLLLLALEPLVASYGLLTVGGLVCLALGASALYTDPGTPTAPDVSVAIPVIVVVVVTIGALMVLVTIAAIRSRRLRPSPGTVGAAVAVGTVGEVRSPLAPIGSVYLAGEEWSARTEDDRRLERGTPVRVIRFDGLLAIVEPETSATQH